MKRYLLILAVLLLSARPAAAGTDEGLSYLRNQQSADGKIQTYPASDWSAMAFGAAGIDSATVGSPVSLHDYLVADPPEPEAPVTDWERHALAMLAMNVDPRNANGVDLVTPILASVTDGQIGDPSFLNDDVFGILALVGAGIAPQDPVVTDATHFLLQEHNTDGGWGATAGGPSSIDDTAAAIETLTLVSGAPGAGEAIGAAAAFLAINENADGGFPNMPGGSSNCLSTAWALRATSTLDASPPAEAVAYLLTCQASNGGFRFRPGDPERMVNANYTSQALLGLMSAHLPIFYRPPVAPPESDPPPPPLPPPVEPPSAPTPPTPDSDPGFSSPTSLAPPAPTKQATPTPLASPSEKESARRKPVANGERTPPAAEHGTEKTTNTAPLPESAAAVPHVAAATPSNTAAVVAPPAEPRAVTKADTRATPQTNARALGAFACVVLAALLAVTRCVLLR